MQTVATDRYWLWPIEENYVQFAQRQTTIIDSNLPETPGSWLEYIYLGVTPSSYYLFPSMMNDFIDEKFDLKEA